MVNSLTPFLILFKCYLSNKFHPHHSTVATSFSYNPPYHALLGCFWIINSGLCRSFFFFFPESQDNNWYISEILKRDLNKINLIILPVPLGFKAIRGKYLLWEMAPNMELLRIMCLRSQCSHSLNNPGIQQVYFYSRTILCGNVKWDSCNWIYWCNNIAFKVASQNQKIYILSLKNSIGAENISLLYGFVQHSVG